MRFQLAVLLTIVIVAYVVVPMVSRLLRSAAGYNPTYYEPKDYSRTSWLSAHVPTVPGFSGDGVVNVALFVLLGLVWLTIMRFRR